MPILALISIVQLRGEINDLEREAIYRARDMGATWPEIADAMGVTRQAMYQRFKSDPRANGRDGAEPVERSA